MAQMRAKRRAAGLQEAPLRVCQFSSATSDLLPFEQNKWLRVAGRCQQETEDQRRAGLRDNGNETIAATLRNTVAFGKEPSRDIHRCQYD
ncbi:unnamed protein product [Onchocerca ochengi]|uniref:Uncharacterized protein n=1 Tax=Onchocerca ochengi TaxID=42157 RepID=A0A182EQM2_ONCOC|nr:unnamed protein product [Onchocerca ochengi]